MELEFDEKDACPVILQQGLVQTDRLPQGLKSEFLNFPKLFLKNCTEDFLKRFSRLIDTPGRPIGLCNFKRTKKADPGQQTTAKKKLYKKEAELRKSLRQFCYRVQYQPHDQYVDKIQGSKLLQTTNIEIQSLCDLANFFNLIIFFNSRTQKFD